MPAWPAGIPQQFLLDGYQETPPDLALRSPMDAGPDKLRRRATAGVRPISGEEIMTTAEVATLETFYVTTTKSGTLSWTHVHPRTAAAASFRFTEAPVYSALGGGQWTVDLAVELLP